MGTKIYVMLSDVALPGFNVKCFCQCGHVGVVDARDLWRWYMIHRWPTAMEVIGIHLRCSICQRRNPRVRPWSMKPDGPVRAPQSEAERKRVVARMR